MNANLDKIAKDLYGKIQVRFPDIEFGDEEGNVLSKKEDIPKARFFEFEYSESGEALGTIAITLDEDDGIVIQISGDLVDDDNSMHGGAYQFIRSFRKFAKTRLLNFDIQNIGKSELDKRDYAFQSKRKEENIMESKMYGTSKISYQDLGEARLVVKHSQPINLDLPAGRTMHIEGIYIENALGERFRYPAKHLNGARALAEHIKHGGNPYDAIGKHICGLSEELASLRKFKGFVSRQEQISEAMGTVTGRVIDRIDQIKETIHKLQRSAYYESFVESFEAQEEQMIPEAIVDDLVNRLTVRTFNEELKSVFPYIYKFIDESEIDVIEVSPDELLSDAYNPNSVDAEHRRGLEKSHEDSLKKKAADGDESAKKRLQALKDKKERMANDYNDRMERESIDPELAFESFMDDIYHEGMSDAVGKDLLFSKDKGIQNKAISDFNDQVLSQELPAGSQGQTAIDTLMGFIDDAQFLNSLRDQDENLDIRSMVQDYVQERDPHVAVQLHFGEEGAESKEVPPAPAPEAPPAPAPEAPPAPAPEAPPAAPMEPAPPAPVAESEDPPFDGPYKDPKDNKDQFGNTIKNKARHLAKKGMASAIAKAKKAGATLDTKLDFGHKEMTLQDAIEECGMTVEEAGFEQAMEMGLPAMLRYVSGFYNKDEGNFPLGGMRVKIKVKKAAEDGEFGEFDPAELMKVIQFIDMKDPSGDEQQNVLRLAGVQQPEREMEEAGGMPDFDGIMQGIQGQLANIQKDPNTKFTQSNTSSGTIDGKPATYGDAMSKANQMQFRMPKFGDDDTDDAPFDFNNPEDIGQRMQKKIGGAFSKMQGQMPNQNVQFPGGQMNPADTMKSIMNKINFGK